MWLFSGGSDTTVSPYLTISPSNFIPPVIHERKLIATRFIKDIDRIASPGYVPTNDDILRGYLDTREMNQTIFSPEKVPGNRTLHVLDISNAQAARALETANVLCFIAPLTGYDLSFSVIEKAVSRYPYFELNSKEFC